MIRTQISMSEEQAEGLRRLAAIRNRSQAALLRDALDDLLGEDVRTRRTQRARLALGGFRSGSRGTSENHDALLEEAFRA